MPSSTCAEGIGMPTFWHIQFLSSAAEVAKRPEMPLWSAMERPYACHENHARAEAAARRITRGSGGHIGIGSGCGMGRGTTSGSGSGVTGGTTSGSDPGSGSGSGFGVGSGPGLGGVAADKRLPAHMPKPLMQ